MLLPVDHQHGAVVRAVTHAWLHEVAQGADLSLLTTLLDDVAVEVRQVDGATRAAADAHPLLRHLPSVRP